MFAWMIVVLTGLAVFTMLLVVTLGAQRLAAILGWFGIPGVRISIEPVTPVSLSTLLLALALGIACVGALKDSRRAAGAAVVLSLTNAAAEVILESSWFIAWPFAFLLWRLSTSSLR